MKHWKRLLLIVFALGLLTAAYERINTPALMSDAAHAYLNSLTPQLRAKTMIPFTDDERLNWHFIPLENRKGVALREMTPPQKHLAEALLSSALSNQGVIKAHTIMSLEQVLKDIEQGKAQERDPEKYFVSIFGEPSEKGTWGFRFEGHHVAMNFTIVNGRIASSPNFFGANPAEVKDGPRAGLRALKREEDIARELVQSLSTEQRKIGIVSTTAPREIITDDSRKAALAGQPNGISYSQLNAKQKEILEALVAEYATNFPPVIADFRMDQFRKNQSSLYFAWLGGVNKGDPHYYRVQTAAFLIEYDSTQNGNNHIHSVWRDFNGDFGLDLLAQHYAADHK
ncbi:MAG: hypothetical protein JWO19_2407 [Bryobacterales bacterium]|jgi:hypothetical protein|nr:hypothetical protein [Bryobacterales bacterium]